MQETVSQDSIHVSQLRLDSVIVERYFTVETIHDTVYIRQESNKQHFSILRDTVYVARSDTIVRWGGGDKRERSSEDRATAQVLHPLPHLYLRLHRLFSSRSIS